jgi:DNA-binding beta-propeller fold protein YncE
MITSRLLTSRLVRLAFAFAFLLVAFQFQTSSVAHVDPGATDVAIFRTSDTSYLELIKLDSVTLDDLPTSQPTGLDPAIVGSNVLISREGQTLVGRSENWDAIVQRVLGGPVVSRFPLGDQAWLVSLSADGSKLLASVSEYESNEYDVWKVFDTATGAVIASHDFTWDRFGPWEFQVDPVHWTMYWLIRREWSQHSVSPWTNRERQLENGEFNYGVARPKGAWMTPPTLVAVDLSTGEETRRLELPPDIANALLDDQDPLLEARGRNISPGFALSPDGSELAIVNATDDDITLIDAETLTVKRTLTMTPKANLVDKLFSVLPLAPQTASAKVQEGVWRRAMYSGDSQRLFVSGYKSDIDEQFTATYQGMGLSIVDLDDGTIEAQLFEGAGVYVLGETADGIVYVSGQNFPGPAAEPSEPFIARFDPDSQEIRAKRSFKLYYEFLFVPVASDRQV